MAVTDLIPKIRSRAPVMRRETNTHPLLSLHEEMNRLFDQFWRDWDSTSIGPVQTFSFPRVEVCETDKEIRVEAELPGVEEKDVELLLEDNELTIRGEKNTERQDKTRRMSERFYGAFERRIPLPTEVQEDKVSATFRKGVLTVTLPKSERAVQKARRIEIGKS